MSLISITLIDYLLLLKRILQPRPPTTAATPERRPRRGCQKCRPGARLRRWLHRQSAFIMQQSLGEEIQIKQISVYIIL